eukprot:TRINITY_DN6899_c0_g3_i10.p3 TRINITY_DN6899_c0_g3~~TRINITY_DN6899_c0_g3_i10.p3  ORF type:complete len:220 (+),score=-5.13 TRINITY_DN6899_c0_g3_i10:266-925(+)
MRTSFHTRYMETMMLPVNYTIKYIYIQTYQDSFMLSQQVFLYIYTILQSLQTSTNQLCNYDYRTRHNISYQEISSQLSVQVFDFKFEWENRKVFQDLWGLLTDRSSTRKLQCRREFQRVLTKVSFIAMKQKIRHKSQFSEQLYSVLLVQTRIFFCFPYLNLLERRELQKFSKLAENRILVVLSQVCVLNYGTCAIGDFVKYVVHLLLVTPIIQNQSNQQ